MYMKNVHGEILFQLKKLKLYRFNFLYYINNALFIMILCAPRDFSLEINFDEYRALLRVSSNAMIKSSLVLF